MCTKFPALGSGDLGWSLLRHQLDRCLLYELDHRADEFIGLKVDVPGKFVTDFELVYDPGT